MKNNFNYKYCRRLIRALLLVIGFSLPALAQENTKREEHKPFKILVEVVGDSIKLNCLEGCAWKELTFHQPYALKGQAVNQFGRTTVHNLNKFKTKEKLADFLFTIMRNPNEIVISSEKGVHWKSLILRCADKGCRHYISEEGDNDKDLQQEY